MAIGTATLDFGVHPGSTDTTVAVTGQTGILAGSAVEAYLAPADTADHSADEHWVDGPVVMAGNIVAGTGFTIYGRANDKYGCYGQWNVRWVWV
jgi:hypothetical protein